MADEPIFYLDLILEDTSAEHPAYLDYQGGATEEAAGEAPATVSAPLLKTTDLGNSLLKGMIHA